MKKEFNLDEAVVRDVEVIAKEACMTLEMLVQIFFNKVQKENSIDFLFAKQSIQQRSLCGDNATSQNQENNLGTDCQVAMVDKIIKSRAIRLFMAKNVKVGRNVTFSSKNSAGQYYWANPNFNMLKKNWYLILNDWLNRKLYLFNIPANAIKTNDMIGRSDMPHLIDIQIMYNDPTFTDNKSQISFKNYLVSKLSY